MIYDDDASAWVCENPCDFDEGAECCEDYWRRMVDEGYWDADLCQWTTKGMREMCK